MARDQGPILDMTADGGFVAPRKPTLGQIALRVALFGLALCIGAVLVWTALLLVPLLLVAGLVGWWVLRGQPGWRRF